MQPTDKRANLRMDLLLVALLIALNVAARLLPHAPGFLPVAASGLSPHVCWVFRHLRFLCRCLAWF